jgi:hypothetical protein
MYLDALAFMLGAPGGLKGTSDAKGCFRSAQRYTRGPGVQYLQLRDL